MSQINPLVQLCLTSLFGLLIAVVTSILTVKLALKRFYSEKWWERKVNAYEAIFAALASLKRITGEYLIAEVTGEKLGKTRASEYSTEYRQSRDAITKTVAIGSFLISEESVAHLAELDRKLFSAENASISFYEQFEE